MWVERKGYKRGKPPRKSRDGNPEERAESDSEPKTESVLGVRGCAGLEVWAAMTAGDILYLLGSAEGGARIY